jgi:hypothetical protein
MKKKMRSQLRLLWHDLRAGRLKLKSNFKKLKIVEKKMRNKRRNLF